MVVAEKAKIDQLNLKKEYEGMINELRLTIDNIKKDAMQNCRTEVPEIHTKLEVVEEDYVSDDSNEQFEEGADGQEIAKKKGKETPHGSSSKINEGKTSGYPSFFSRPSSIISGLTSRTSLTKSTSNNDMSEKDKLKDSTDSPKNERSSRDKTSRSDQTKEKRSKKDRLMKALSPDRLRSRKFPRSLSDDFPMMDDTGSPSPCRISPEQLEKKPTHEDVAKNENFDLEKSISSPTVPSRPKILELKSQNDDPKASSAASSPDSPTLDIPRLHFSERARSPTGFGLHRPGSTPGPLVKQGSMTTVPEDRAIDTRSNDFRPSDPPPPPPTNRVFAISRQNSTPNISVQKAAPPPTLHRQHSLGVVLEESKPVTRQDSVMSMPDERLIVDKTLPMSPTPSLMNFQGGWSTTSLNRQDSSAMNGDGYAVTNMSPKPRSRGGLEQVAGGVLAGSSFQAGKVSPFSEKDEEPPLATSSLKKRKKAKKDPVVV